PSSKRGKSEFYSGRSRCKSRSKSQKSLPQKCISVRSPGISSVWKELGSSVRTDRPQTLVVNSWCSLSAMSPSGRCASPPGITSPPWCVPCKPMPSTEERWVWVPFEVDKKYDGYRIDRFLAQRLAGYSRNKVQGILAAARVLKER